MAAADSRHAWVTEPCMSRDGQATREPAQPLPAARAGFRKRFPVTSKSTQIHLTEFRRFRLTPPSMHIADGTGL